MAASSLLIDVVVLHFEIAMQGAGGGGLRETSNCPTHQNLLHRLADMSYIYIYIYIYIYEENGVWGLLPGSFDQGSYFNMCSSKDRTFFFST